MPGWEAHVESTIERRGRTVYLKRWVKGHEDTHALAVLFHLLDPTAEQLANVDRMIAHGCCTEVCFGIVTDAELEAGAAATEIANASAFIGKP